MRANGWAGVTPAAKTCHALGPHGLRCDNDRPGPCLDHVAHVAPGFRVAWGMGGAPECFGPVARAVDDLTAALRGIGEALGVAS